MTLPRSSHDPPETLSRPSHDPPETFSRPSHDPPKTAAQHEERNETFSNDRISTEYNFLYFAMFQRRILSLSPGALMTPQDAATLSHDPPETLS